MLHREKLYKLNSPRYKATSQKILVLLAKQAMTKHEIAEEMALNHSTISNYLYFLKKQGMIYISAWDFNSTGKPTARFRFGTNEDVEYLLTNKNKYRNRYRQKAVTLKMPRCDIAASWMFNPC